MLLLLLFFLIAKGFSLAPNPYNYEVFALHRCHASDANWTVHGVWPEYYQNSWPSYCHQTPFDFKAIEPLVSRLNLDWHDCYCHHDQTCTGLWKHEWSKHGTCSSLYPDQYSYFLEGLELYTVIASQGLIETHCQEGTSCYFYWDPFNRVWLPGPLPPPVAFY